MLHWYFILIMSGMPTQFGPFETRVSCEKVSNEIVSYYKMSVERGSVIQIGCWKFEGV
jgi:hypothetical protein